MVLYGVSGIEEKPHTMQGVRLTKKEPIRRLYHIMSINEMTVEQLETELKEATQSVKYVEEEIRLTGNEDLYKYAREFNSYANKVRERLDYIKEIE